MKKKKKAFTLLELIITLSITLIVLGTIYTFFLSNTKTMKTAEINTDLQAESQKIESELLKYGTEAKGIVSINGSEIKDNNMIYTDALDENGKIDVTEVVFNVEGNKFKYSFNRSTGVLIIKKNSEEEVELSKNIKEMKIRPLDYRMKPDGKFCGTNGVEVSFVLNVKKGYSDVAIPSSVIVKFRNK